MNGTASRGALQLCSGPEHSDSAGNACWWMFWMWAETGVAWPTKSALDYLKLDFPLPRPRTCPWCKNTKYTKNTRIWEPQPAQGR